MHICEEAVKRLKTVGVTSSAPRRTRPAHFEELPDGALPSLRPSLPVLALTAADSPLLQPPL